MEGSGVEIKYGLEGVIFTETRLSAIDGNAGKLSYCGYDIRDLAAGASYEETAFLLWYQRLPAGSELEMLSLVGQLSGPEKLVRVGMWLVGRADRVGGEPITSPCS